jgi:guanylate cyclase
LSTTTTLNPKDTLKVYITSRMTIVYYKCHLYSIFFILYSLGLLKDEVDEYVIQGFQSYIGVVATPFTGSEMFTFKVNHYLQLPPFNIENPVNSFGGLKRVS